MFTIEEKAIQLGKNCIVVTIPALFRRSQKIRAHDVLLVEINENELRIRPKSKGTGSVSFPGLSVPVPSLTREVGK